jgi:hypothetical protein
MAEIKRKILERADAQQCQHWGHGERLALAHRACVPYHYLFRCPQHLADFENRVNFTGPREERPESVHLCHDAAHGPDVNGGAVVGRPQEDFWSPVPGGTK